MKMPNIMLDLETLSTKPNAAVISIGAVEFDPNTDRLGEKFFRAIKLGSVEEHQHMRHVSPTTIGWWMQQTPGAQQASFLQGTVDSYEALCAFVDFVESYGSDVRMWGNGAAFDNTIMGTLLTDLGFPVPWHFRYDRCYRTLKNLGFGPKSAERVGTYHNPLDDAITQAVHTQQIYKAMTEGQASVKSFT